MSVWAELKHFKKTENWGDPDKMNPAFLIQLDRFRSIIRQSFVLTSPAYEASGHAENSYHYKGEAVDGRFVYADGRALSLRDHVFLAMKSPFMGVGIYTWSQNGSFLHFDFRETDERKIWVCRRRGEYETLNSDLLRLLIL